MAWTLCTEQEAVDLAGTGVSSVIIADTTAIASYSNMVEGVIDHRGGRTFVASYANLQDPLKGLLRSAASAKAARMMVVYDTSGYFNSREAETIMDNLDDIYNEAIKLIKEWASANLKAVSA